MSRAPAIHIGEVVGVASTLVQGLNNAGWPVEHRMMPVPAAKAGLATKLLKAGPRVAGARELRSELRSRGAIAHVHFATAGAFFLGRHPLVVHCHGSDVRDPRLPLRPVLAAVMSSADLVIAATPDLMQNLPPTAVYLPNPVDTQRFAPTGDEPDRDVLIFAALTDIKGASELLEVAKGVMDRRPGTTVTAIAHGGWVDEFAAAGVELLPFTGADELPALLRRFRVVLGQRSLGVPGTSEIQALATGLPVVMPLRSDLDVDWTPPPVITGDVGATVEAVRDLLEDEPRRDELARRGREWAIAHHGVAAVTDRLIDMYQQLG